MSLLTFHACAMFSGVRARAPLRAFLSAYRATPIVCRVRSLSKRTKQETWECSARRSRGPSVSSAPPEQHISWKTNKVSPHSYPFTTARIIFSVPSSGAMAIAAVPARLDERLRKKFHLTDGSRTTGQRSGKEGRTKQKASRAGKMSFHISYSGKQTESKSNRSNKSVRGAARLVNAVRAGNGLVY